ncbi:MAG: DUF4260 domain-containing protein [Ardenticatenaceae bacterium]|nr:DUF4260 domain-containing protein [Ardenticatenaceae bacterium]
MTQQLQKLPRILLHLEGAAVLITALIFYGQNGYSWWLFALLLMAPDLSAIGYLHSQTIGSLCYNAVHTYVLPIALTVLSLLLNWELGLQLALIWLAHIGMDRLVGYGLKYPDGFKVTHFNKV